MLSYRLCTIFLKLLQCVFHFFHQYRCYIVREAATKKTRPVSLSIGFSRFPLLTVLLFAALRPLDPLPYLAQAKPLSPHLPAAPGLSGFGSSTTAGSGRHLIPPRTSVIIVSSLHDRGEASLRNCIEYPAPRVCIFTVAGEIILESPLIISHPYLTIAGQTAPSPGITISHSSLIIQSHDILIQHLALRPGDCPFGTDPSERDAISIGHEHTNVYNVVLDHLSTTWAIDENIGIWYPTTHDITISNSIIAEGLHRSLHPKGPHSKGLLVGRGIRNISILRSLFAFNDERNPYIQGGTHTEFVNNVVYGWGSNGAWCLSNISDYSDASKPTVASFRANKYVAAPWSYLGFFLFAKRIHIDSKIYWKNNSFTAGTALAVPLQPPKSLISVRTDERPHTLLSNSHILKSTEVMRHVLRNAGTRPWDRDTVDTRIINHIRERSGTIRNNGRPCQMHSKKHYSQAIKRPFQARIPSTLNATVADNGYTKLENWLHTIRVK